jgi:hypothetical protein
VLERIIHAQLWHMTVFTATIRRNLSLKEASASAFPLSKIERHFAWYLHFHRARHFVRSARIDDFHILRQVAVEFRNLRAAVAADRRNLRADWPTREAELRKSLEGDTAAGGRGPRLLGEDSPELIVAAVGPYGLMRFERWTAGEDKTLFHRLFQGLFSGDVEATGSFFADLLARAPWLCGHPVDPLMRPAAVYPLVDPHDPETSRADLVNLGSPAERDALLKHFART